VYNVRDLLGHFVKPAKAQGEMCPHRCCRGRRPHPDRFPLILPKSLLRDAPEEELWAHLDRHASHAKGQNVEDQIVKEVIRRDTLKENKRRRGERAKDRRADRSAEFAAHLENEWIQAEKATNGNFTNKAGKSAGIDGRSLFTGPESRVRKYGSRELREYFESHPRVSRSEFLGGEAAQRRGGRARQASQLYGIY
jgi:hypothetical protein